MPQDISYVFKCNSFKCNSNQKWNNKTCKRQYKSDRKWKKLQGGP